MSYTFGQFSDGVKSALHVVGPITPGPGQPAIAQVTAVAEVYLGGDVIHDASIPADRILIESKTFKGPSTLNTGPTEQATNVPALMDSLAVVWEIAYLEVPDPANPKHKIKIPVPKYDLESVGFRATITRGNETLVLHDYWSGGMHRPGGLPSDFS